ncbi:hypothetical protein [Sphingomonas leidyi]|uniref:hypothetical protein n=1 Tax=Sphingomonas leidyi TaxID=68569 RepID=UPI0036D26AC7
MTGVDIVGALLREDPAFVAMVPTPRIKAGALPENVELTAVLLRLISSVERQPLKRGATIRTTDRVSVTVRASSYRDQRAAIALAKKVCAGRTGDIGGGLRVSILTAGTGPDLRGAGNSFEQTQDFTVSYDAAA